ncbi:hypothetical protein NA56DRAFT_649300 [Hyaloscypha hepaticicola]|uniref:SnoaL-like domain-containing protein n=1 Tax=Hyaloscypha hepaticicola TaxID=2082293 RepID=A0A2J6PRT0_9HELO|nr:hypothetical protein NA56DRAFT_649300 [Hyaloscypha hepaticicola]
MAIHPDEAHITARQEKYRQAINSCSIDEAMSFFSEDVHFSDFSIGQVNLTKPQLHAYITNMIESCDNMTTVSINGDTSCTSWEWNITFNYVKKMVKVANDKELGNLEVGGGLLKMVGVSVTWWNVEDKIIRNHDYAKLVENFDGR